MAVNWHNQSLSRKLITWSCKCTELYLQRAVYSVLPWQCLQALVSFHYSRRWPIIFILFWHIPVIFISCIFCYVQNFWWFFSQLCMIIFQVFWLSFVMLHVCTRWRKCMKIQEVNLKYRYFMYKYNILISDTGYVWIYCFGE